MFDRKTGEIFITRGTDQWVLGPVICLKQWVSSKSVILSFGSPKFFVWEVGQAQITYNNKTSHA